MTSVNLKFWGSNSSKTYVELVGVDKGNASTLAWRQNFSAMARSLILKPQHYAIFRVGITAPNHEGIFQGQAFVETQYEDAIPSVHWKKEQVTIHPFLAYVKDTANDKLKPIPMCV
ncbi:hypothetical protein AVEN_181885-1, partial [Araneus ventricosus]